jgi:hypothetical protein
MLRRRLRENKRDRKQKRWPLKKSQLLLLKPNRKKKRVKKLHKNSRNKLKLND